METQQSATRDIIPLDSYPIVSSRPDLLNLQQGWTLEGPAFALHDVCADSCILSENEAARMYMFQVFILAPANTDCPDTTSAVMRRCGESWARGIDKRVPKVGHVKLPVLVNSTTQHNQASSHQQEQEQPTSHSTYTTSTPWPAPAQPPPPQSPASWTA
jgi:hypothetical protein